MVVLPFIFEVIINTQTLRGILKGRSKEMLANYLLLVYGKINLNQNMKQLHQ